MNRTAPYPYLGVPPPPLPQFYRHVGSRGQTAGEQIIATRPPLSAVAAPPAIFMQATREEVPPLAVYHICRICLRPRSARYHREHPIPLNAVPPPPGICRRCRFTSVHEHTSVVDLVEHSESNDIRLGIKCLVPEEDYFTQEEMKDKRINKLIAAKEGRTRHASRDRVSYRHVEVASSPSASPSRLAARSIRRTTVREVPASCAAVSTQGLNSTARTQADDSARAIPSTDISIRETHTKYVGQATLIAFRPRALSRAASQDSDSSDTHGNAVEVSRQNSAGRGHGTVRVPAMPQLQESQVRRIAREEVERYREAERRIDAHGDPYARGRAVAVEPTIPQIGSTTMPVRHHGTMTYAHRDYHRTRERELGEEVVAYAVPAQPTTSVHSVRGSNLPSLDINDPAQCEQFSQGQGRAQRSMPLQTREGDGTSATRSARVSARDQLSYRRDPGHAGQDGSAMQAGPGASRSRADDASSRWRDTEYWSNGQSALTDRRGKYRDKSTEHGDSLPRELRMAAVDKSQYVHANRQQVNEADEERAEHCADFDTPFGSRARDTSSGPRGGQLGPREQLARAAWTGNIPPVDAGEYMYLERKTEKATKDHTRPYYEKQSQEYLERGPRAREHVTQGQYHTAAGAEYGSRRTRAPPYTAEIDGPRHVSDRRTRHRYKSPPRQRGINIRRDRSSDSERESPTRTYKEPRTRRSPVIIPVPIVLGRRRNSDTKKRISPVHKRRVSDRLSLPRELTRSESFRASREQADEYGPYVIDDVKSHSRVAQDGSAMGSVTESSESSGSHSNSDDGRGRR